MKPFKTVSRDVVRSEAFSEGQKESRRAGSPEIAVGAAEACVSTSGVGMNSMPGVSFLAGRRIEIKPPLYREKKEEHYSSEEELDAILNKKCTGKMIPILRKASPFESSPAERENMLLSFEKMNLEPRCPTQKFESCDEEYGSSNSRGKEVKQEHQSLEQTAKIKTVISRKRRKGVPRSMSESGATDYASAKLEKRKRGLPPARSLSTQCSEKEAFPADQSEDVDVAEWLQTIRTVKKNQRSDETLSSGGSEGSIVDAKPQDFN